MRPRLCFLHSHLIFDLVSKKRNDAFRQFEARILHPQFVHSQMFPGRLVLILLQHFTFVANQAVIVKFVDAKNECGKGSWTNRWSILDVQFPYFRHDSLLGQSLLAVHNFWLQPGIAARRPVNSDWPIPRENGAPCFSIILPMMPFVSHVQCFHRHQRLEP